LKRKGFGIIRRERVVGKGLVKKWKNRGTSGREQPVKLANCGKKKTSDIYRWGFTKLEKLVKLGGEKNTTDGQNVKPGGGESQEYCPYVTGRGRKTAP